MAGCEIIQTGETGAQNVGSSGSAALETTKLTGGEGVNLCENGRLMPMTTARAVSSRSGRFFGDAGRNVFN